MILHVNKMQEGGAMSPSSQAYGFLDYTPYVSSPAVSGGNRPSTQTETPKQSELLSDDMIKGLMGKGLTNDVNAFVSAVSSMYSDPAASNPFGSSINSSDLARKQLGLLSRINQIQNNKDTFNKVVDQARSTGGLTELAITTFGRVLAIDNESGGIKQVTPEELYKDRGLYTPITNAQVAEMRMNNPSLAFDTNTFNTIGNAVSSKQVDDVIRQAINEANHMTVENNQFRSAEELREVQAGLKELQSGIYKEKTLTETNANQINSAINYLYRVLPSNYKTFLKAKSAEMGLDPEKGMADLIGDYAGVRQQLKTSRDVQYQSLATKGAKDSKGSSLENTPFVMLYNAQGASRVPVITNPGSEFQSKITGIHLGYIPNQKGDIIPNYTSVQKTLDSGLGGLANTDEAYFGGQKIATTDLSKMIYTGGGVTRVEVPTDNNGNPDFALIKRYENAKDKVLSERTSDPERIKAIFEENGIGNYLLGNGQVDKSKFKSYFMLNSAASTKEGVVEDETVLSGNVVPIKSMSGMNNKDARNKFKTEFRNNVSDPESGIVYNPDDIYFAPLFIEDRGNMDLALSVSKAYAKLPETRNIYERSALNENEEDFKYSGSDILNQ